MSRAINLRLPEADVKNRCDRKGVSISVLETLPSGGTRLVCTTSEGAEEMRQVFHSHIIDGKVPRFPFFRAGTMN